MIREHDPVVLTEALPELGLEAGDVGIAIHIYDMGKAYEVEFLTLEGESAAIATLSTRQVRAAEKGEIAHVRHILTA